MAREKRISVLSVLTIFLPIMAVSSCVTPLAGKLAALAAGQSTGIVAVNGALVVRAGDRWLLRYRYEGVPYKPYVQELFTPAGVNILRDAPADHLHHHALMFAVAVEGVNFWEEQQQPGRQRHLSFAHYVKAGDGNNPEAAGFDEQLEWVNPRTDEVLATELRRILVCRMKEQNATVLKWVGKLSPAAGKDSVTLTGSPYFGLGMRFLESMDTGGQFHSSTGQTGVENTNDKRAKWCAYVAKADGKAVTVAMFDYPDNVRHPATWFTMEKPFAYLSATLALHKEPLKITAGEPLVLRYGVALWDGRVSPEQIEKAYSRWVDWSR
jgi:hypothetical protein